MTKRYIKSALRFSFPLLGLLLVFGNDNVAFGNNAGLNVQLATTHTTRLKFPEMNAEAGKDTFVNKGCIACHAINGVGGHDAPAMDAHRQMNEVNPFNFAAKMWNHAPGMIAAQEDAFDEQINLTGQELANIIAFVHDDNAQHTFSENDLTSKARKMMGHSHGEMPAPKAHAKDAGHSANTGHTHAPGTPKHSY